MDSLTSSRKSLSLSLSSPLASHLACPRSSDMSGGRRATMLAKRDLSASSLYPEKNTSDILLSNFQDVGRTSLFPVSWPGFRVEGQPDWPACQFCPALKVSPNHLRIRPSTRQADSFPRSNACACLVARAERVFPGMKRCRAPKEGLSIRGAGIHSPSF